MGEEKMSGLLHLRRLWLTLKVWDSPKFVPPRANFPLAARRTEPFCHT